MRNKELFPSASSQREEGKGKEDHRVKNREWLLQEDKTNGYFRQRNYTAKAQLKHWTFELFFF